MSKQSEAKLKQNYTPKAVPRTCGTCDSFKFDRVQTHPPTRYQEDGWWGDRNLRCSIGAFAIKKKATCDLHAVRREPEEL